MLTKEQRKVLLAATLSQEQQNKVNDLKKRLLDNDISDRDKEDIVAYKLFTRGYRHFYCKFYDFSNPLNPGGPGFREDLKEKIARLQAELNEKGIPSIYRSDDPDATTHFQELVISQCFDSFIQLIDHLSPRKNASTYVDTGVTYSIKFNGLRTRLQSYLNIDSFPLFISDIKFEFSEGDSKKLRRGEALTVINKYPKYYYTIKQTSPVLKLIWADDMICLIDKTLYEKYQLRNIIPSTWSVLRNLKSTLQKFSELSRDNILSTYCNNSDSAYARDFSLAKRRHEATIRSLEINLFLSALSHFKRHQTRKAVNHHFVISKVKELNNEQFGRLGEKVLCRFLKERYEDGKWASIRTIQSILSASDCKINWVNESEESYQFYDIEIKLGDHRLRLEVKATRSKQDMVFYLSIGEIEALLENPDNFILCRIFSVEEGETFDAISINEEMAVNFYVVTEETISIIRRSLVDWKEYYNEKSIRFTTEHFIEITNLTQTFQLPQFGSLSLEPEKYQGDFEEFIEREYFREPFRLLGSYSSIDDNIAQLAPVYRAARLDPKFKL